MVPKMETPGLRGPASAGSACVPRDLRTNPKTTAAIPSGIVRPPNWTNTLPTPTHVAFGGNVRPPTWAQGSLPITAKIVRSGGRILVIAYRSRSDRRGSPKAGSARCRAAARQERSSPELAQSGAAHSVHSPPHAARARPGAQYRAQVGHALIGKPAPTFPGHAPGKSL